MIQFYLGEDAIINNVPTRVLRNADAGLHVLEHLHELVVKEVHGSGGYGMLIGPTATAAERRAFQSSDAESRRTTSPSRHWRCPRCPTLVDSEIVPAPRGSAARSFLAARDEPDRRRLTRVALVRARWLSIRPRAAAPRTPGFWSGLDC